VLQKTNSRNRQVQRTRGWIFEALLLLMDEKQYNKIKVSDICKKAGIARPTFYRNFNEKSDILVEYFLTVFKASIFKAGKNKSNAIVLKFNYNYMLENFGTLKKLVLNLDVEKFFLPRVNLFPELLLEEFKNTLTPEEYLICRDKVYYQMSGSLRVISDWIRNDMPMPVENLVEILNSINIPKKLQSPHIPNVIIRIDNE
jgi:AcrR family transcriptional regulator